MPLERPQFAEIKGNCKVFVESGSSTGCGIDKALRCGFEMIHSVELSELYFKQVSNIFGDSPQIKLYHGDSAETFRNVILPLLTEPALFWIDAHFSAPDSSGDERDPPVLRELAAIRDSGQKHHTIVVDDLRLFKKDVCGFDHWDVINAVREINPDYQITFMDAAQGDGSVEISDVLVARVKQ